MQGPSSFVKFIKDLCSILQNDICGDLIIFGNCEEKLPEKPVSRLVVCV